MQVPSGCPPPRIASNSRNPTDVNVIPPVHGFVPEKPLTEEATPGRCRRRNEDDMVTSGDVAIQGGRKNRNRMEGIWNVRKPLVAVTRNPGLPML
jgi:hypothetical protein